MLFGFPHEQRLNQLVASSMMKSLDIQHWCLQLPWHSVFSGSWWRYDLMVIRPSRVRFCAHVLCAKRSLKCLEKKLPPFCLFPDGFFPGVLFKYLGQPEHQHRPHSNRIGGWWSHQHNHISCFRPYALRIMASPSGPLAIGGYPWGASVTSKRWCFTMGKMGWG